MERARKGCGRGCASLTPPLLPSRGCGVVLIITFHFELLNVLPEYVFFVVFFPSARPSENTPYRGDVAFSDGSEMRCLPLSLRSPPKPCHQQHRCTWFLRHYTVIPDKTSYQHIVDSQLEREASTLLLILETSWTVDSRATGAPDTNTHINRAGPGGDPLFADQTSASARCLGETEEGEEPVWQSAVRLHPFAAAVAHSRALVSEANRS